MWRILIVCLCLWQATSAQHSLRTNPMIMTTCNRLMDTIRSLHTSCKDVRATESRVKAVLLDGAEVLCDTETDGGGWTVIQRRFDGELDFNVDWNRYEYGFGSLDGEFWMGLKLMHELTYKRCYQLRVEVRQKERDYFALYSYFKINGANDNYRLWIGQFIDGNTYDSMAYEPGQAFTTKDRDNDAAPYNCAVEYPGGWWHKKCVTGYLNGIWKTEFGTRWKTDKDTYINGLTGIDYTEMKIRPCDWPVTFNYKKCIVVVVKE